jgi:hypothetical protein
MAYDEGQNTRRIDSGIETWTHSRMALKALVTGSENSLE